MMVSFLKIWIMRIRQPLYKQYSTIVVSVYYAAKVIHVSFNFLRLNYLPYIFVPKSQQPLTLFVQFTWTGTVEEKM